ncbi:carbon-nitrogen hydrolase family protein [Pelagibius sp. Alg239-R121]|uniref:carbon-nitrogen hydrolase family protein n=1 Tax=Pelagibius sp. Alg239-R121 TaxID=2993448 RepID=UPI0024A668A2|nr:carbon-nitrogen hydrolase family protein [Pelagibius sp. Alg239-R121]
MRSGIFQSAGGGLTPEQRFDRLSAALLKTQLDLVVCPELFLSGYNVGESITELAEAFGGALTGQLTEIARHCGTAIVFGYPERDGNKIYNSAACIDSSGRLLANHRKLLLPPGFESQYFTSGGGLTLFELNGIRCSILVCYDAEFPEAVRASAEAGAQVVLVPTALVDNWGSVAYQMMPTRAFENGVWLLYANHAGQENGSCYLGASCIVAPDGSDVVRAGDGEEVIAAELDIERVTAAQVRLPYLKDLQRLRNVLASGP